MGSGIITAFLPCRKGSERVKEKNTRPFSGFTNGLVEVKIHQLLKTKLLDQILVSTDDETVIGIAEAFNDSRIHIDLRDKVLCSSTISTDDLIKYIPRIISEGSVLWTHTTSPFVNEHDYEQAIKQFQQLNSDYDSLMSVTKIQEFIWSQKEAYNYDRAIEKWPRTQTLKPLYVINSAMFIAPIGIYRECSDRIGKRPYLFEMDKIKAWEIDWPDDFVIAEQILKTNHAQV